VKHWTNPDRPAQQITDLHKDDAASTITTIVGIIGITLCFLAPYLIAAAAIVLCVRYLTT